MADQQQRAPPPREGIGQLLHPVQVEVVGRLVQHQQLRDRPGEQPRRERRSKALASGEFTESAQARVADEEQPRRVGMRLLRRRLGADGTDRVDDRPLRMLDAKILRQQGPRDEGGVVVVAPVGSCLLYTSDAADDREV